MLSTPTGSGKSLVALALHFRGAVRGRALVLHARRSRRSSSEKFFALCDELGADDVGMLTGDASINPGAPVICCTAEVLANMALRQGERADAPYVVLDEFHYYADRERGMRVADPAARAAATATFLLMSATLGNTAAIEERLAEFTQRERRARALRRRGPVPLDFEYRETPLHETLGDLVEHDRAPVYVVNFTQRECGELAQGADQREPRVARGSARRSPTRSRGVALRQPPTASDVKRFLGHGVGIHHAGLLAEVPAARRAARAAGPPAA